MLALATLAVGFVFFFFGFMILTLASGVPGRSSLGGVAISVVPAILAMTVVARELWPVKRRERSRRATQDRP
jgi:hypothetical protein